MVSVFVSWRIAGPISARVTGRSSLGQRNRRSDPAFGGTNSRPAGRAFWDARSGSCTVCGPHAKPSLSTVVWECPRPRSRDLSGRCYAPPSGVGGTPFWVVVGEMLWPVPQAASVNARKTSTRARSFTVATLS